MSFHRFTLRGGPSASGLTIQLDGRDLRTVTAVNVEAAVGQLVAVTLTFLAEVDIDVTDVDVLSPHEYRSEEEMVAPERPTTAARATTEPAAGPGA